MRTTVLIASLCSAIALAIHLGALSATAVRAANRQPALLGRAAQRPDGAEAEQADDLLFDALAHPAIEYRTTEVHDPAAELDRQLEAGTAHLSYDRAAAGYLRSLLDALRIPVESQMAVFSKTSLQSPLISATNPRAIYFTDDVAVAWPRGGFIEIASHDARQGVQFYMLQQQEVERPRLMRPDAIRSACLTCHHAYATLGVPGLLARSVAAGGDGRILPHLANYITDDRSPLDERWAGWFVTGSTGAARHLGNPDAVTGRATEPMAVSHATTITSLADRGAFDGYLTPYSDVAALLVFNHQTRMVNLLTRTAWVVRIAEADRGDVQKIAREAATPLVDALLFVDEAALPGPIASSSGFAALFSARGPADSSGRSLRQLDLTTRLMRYPCSYMIYAPAFDRLPAAAKSAVYQRLWDVLSGREAGRRYARLSARDRRAIIEILRATKSDLPPYFS